MFCTACAAHNHETLLHCTDCGAELRHDVRGSGPRHRRRRTVVEWLRVVPLVALLAAGGYGLSTYRGDRATLAGAYARAESALAAGDYDGAIAGFTEAGRYRDAPARREQALTTVAPVRTEYLRGLDALNAGRYDEAIASLTSVLRELPAYEDAAALLAEARTDRSKALLAEAEHAEGRRDWLAAEQALSLLLVDDPENRELRDRLRLLQRRHAPIVFSRAGAVYITGPDLIDERLVTDEATAVWPVWSPDRSMIAFYALTDPSRGRYGLYVVGRDGGSPRRLADDVRLEGWPVWSPDSTRLAFVSMADFILQGNQGLSSIRVVDLGTGTQIDLTSTAVHYALNPTWSPDGTRIAFVSKRVYNRGAAVGRRVEGALHVVDLRTREITDIAAHQLPFVEYVTWSPVDDLLLVFSSELGSAWYETQITTLAMINLRTGVIDDLTNRSQTVGYPFWSPDGSHYAFTEGSDVIQVRSVAGAKTWVNMPRDIAPFLSWSPDGSMLIAPANSATASAMIVPVTGSGSPEEFPLAYDYSAELAGPPQWAPRTSPAPAETGATSGTALDR